ncbi:MAG: gamma-glutamyl-gamma-aminobutyrate hydrolase family protein [Corynebacterium sp.]|nr:gamma-glutamyl-gamma-aminobutyrate hydrolase family protein [Corynebacterium sp.]
MSNTRILLIDNQDSFVYNLVDAFATTGFDCTVYRNTVSLEEIEAFNPDVLCLSPGPGHPRQAGVMMAAIEKYQGKIPILGICLGFQALLEHFGGTVAPVGAVHGITDHMVLTEAGQASPIFKGLTVGALPGEIGTEVPVARYHSLGCVDVPEGLVSLASISAPAGEISMAAQSADGMSIGLQFHPESVLSPSGPHILRRAIELLSKGQA